jgi:hemoglobin-like flavoprotein
MTPEQTSIVQQTYQQMLPGLEDLGDGFYERLFQIEPGLKALFPEDIHQQGNKFADMIRVIVISLHHIETVMPAIQALGQRHRAYGATSEYFESVKVAFLGTLEERLGQDFTPEVREAWSEMLTAVSVAMQAAMKG